jgi:ABC-2 type transport system permease protein
VRTRVGRATPGGGRTRLVAEREIRQGLGSRAYRISVVVTAAIIAVVGLLPRLIQGNDRPPTYRIGVPADAPASLPAALDAAAPVAGAHVEVRSVADRSDAATRVRGNDLDAALVGDEVLVDGDPPDRLRALVEQAHATAVRGERAAQAGLSAPQIDALSAPVPPIALHSVSGKKASGDELAVATVALVALFMAVTFYGGAVMNGVLQEKSSRVVEVVLATVSPRQLLAGKLLGIGALGVAQVGLLAVVALATTQVAGTARLPSSTVATIALAVVWFVLGYALFSALFAMAGSLVSRQEDAQAAATPVSLVTTGSYLLAFAVVLPHPAGSGSRILTFVPLTAPTTVLARAALGRIAVWEIALSALLTAGAVVGVVAAAARVYSGAALHTGARLRWREALRAGRETRISGPASGGSPSPERRGTA